MRCLPGRECFRGGVPGAGCVRSMRHSDQQRGRTPAGTVGGTLAGGLECSAANLTGYFVCAQAFGRDMLARGSGVLVHIASIAAGQPQGMSGAYSASKAGVAMLSRQLAFEWGPRGIRSNTVSPGLIRTALSESFYQAPGVKERREAIVPLRAIGRPLDIANV